MSARWHFSCWSDAIDAGATIKRHGCLGSVTLVISPPASTSRAGERNVGEELERIATSIAAALRSSPADAAEPPGQTDARTQSNRSRHLCGVAIVIFPAELATHEDRTRRGPEICTKR